MTYDNTLIELKQKLVQKNQLEAKLRELQDQRRIYDREMISLQVAYGKEQEDVEKLEGKSLANYFFQVIGKLDEKLDREREEAYAAKVKMDTCQQELRDIECNIQDMQRQISESKSAEKLYQEAFEQKRVMLQSAGGAAGEKVLDIEEKIGLLEAQKKEIKEAISAGITAKGTADRILSELEDADGWNTWDMFGGGGLVTHMVKHGHLDEAQNMVQTLQGQLRQFKTELADIQISAEVQVNIEGFLRFADYFFDGLFADWAVGDKINQSMDSVQSTKNQISHMLTKLSDMENAAEQEVKRLRKELDDLIVKA